VIISLQAGGVNPDQSTINSFLMEINEQTLTRKCALQGPIYGGRSNMHTDPLQQQRCTMFFPG
jgi:hypothetical protein